MASSEHSGCFMPFGEKLVKGSVRVADRWAWQGPGFLSPAKVCLSRENLGGWRVEGRAPAVYNLGIYDEA